VTCEVTAKIRSMPSWHVTLRLPDGDRRALLDELRRRPGVDVRDVDERTVTVEVGAPDEARVRRGWAPAAAASALRVDGGWMGDWWDGDDIEEMEPEYVLRLSGDGPGADLLVAVPFHHFSVDGSGRRLTLFWNGYASCRPGPATAEERGDGVIVTVTERRPSGALAIGGCGTGDRARFGRRRNDTDQPDMINRWRGPTGNARK
jgi:hypothetical protein